MKQGRWIRSDFREVRMSWVEQVIVFVRHDHRCHFEHGGRAGFNPPVAERLGTQIAQIASKAEVPVSSTFHRPVSHLRRPIGRIGHCRHGIRGAPSGWDVVFDSGQRLFYQHKSFIASQQFGRCPISQQCQRRRQPVCRLLLVAEHGNSMGDHGHEASDYAG